MAQYTQYYNLIKPEAEDFFTQAGFNTNADVIDAALHSLNQSIQEIESSGGGSGSGSGSSGSGEAVWGQIGGSLSNQTDLKSALDAKANNTDIATVGKTGNYNDLSNKPTIPSLTGYATQAWVNNQGFAKNSTLSDYALKSELTANANTVKQWVEDKGYLTSQDISGKQDSLVSGTNIKTINGSSILGSGNLIVSGSDEVYVGAVEPSESEGYKIWVDTTSEDTMFELLWENEDTIDSSYVFEEQTINLDLSEYSAMYIDFLVRNAYTSHVCQMCIKGINSRIFIGGYTTNTNEVIYSDRIVTSTNSGISFGNAQMNGVESNNVCIPIKIYGVR